ncbi:translesion DNA synthesis-associated protein ImuA [Burkholderia cenocepacia]|uniref:translesion DNA synthesis-associated protein ImuA n=1 Tax=Burkholderia cenocepacia TaxID=95486 RepID=UPI0028633184|nr:translesion DNA synthesis-associated protein ImuA [Burkholderia cenocepacia]MDR5646768.1 translesion DNA synthesis-associated protein ImuA [Burkholderia cenocepacia]
MSAAAIRPETIHPSLWRASQLAHARGRTVDTGYAALSAELPGGGWPLRALTDLLVQQAGIGELRLLAPALTAPDRRPVALLEPPLTPNAFGLIHIGLPCDRLMLLRAPRTADALWSAEQILRAGTCSALVLWQQHVKTSSLRRLHLAAQSAETLFFVVQPVAVAQNASPAVLRLAIRPSPDGAEVEIIKRRGPLRAEPLSVALHPTPILTSFHARLPRRSSAPAPARSIPSGVAA